MLPFIFNAGGGEELVIFASGELSANKPFTCVVYQNSIGYQSQTPDNRMAADMGNVNHFWMIIWVAALSVVSVAGVFLLYIGFRGPSRLNKVKDSYAARHDLIAKKNQNDVYSYLPRFF
jgi:hypothetical protein